MPELPEVETVRAGLANWITGEKIKRSQQLHPRAVKGDIPINIFDGAKIEKVNRRGKFLWLEFNRPEVLVAHLGMSGQFLIQPKGSSLEKHARAVFELKSGPEVRFIDQRTFGWISVSKMVGEVPELVSHIALDLFDPNFSFKKVAQKIASRNTQIKKALLDQSNASGIGNIYADEALWLAQIHPETSTKDLSHLELEKLLRKAKTVMAAALKAGGTSFDDLYINVNGESGYFERRLKVYGREGEPCRRCGREIQRIAFANRSSHLCPRCQKR
ncbi:MAG: hypothetical protein RL448_689 [Actinomycetota bacterium]|jgi:formamidopyrimidine-DNA glycosylase